MSIPAPLSDQQLMEMLLSSNNFDRDFAWNYVYKNNRPVVHELVTGNKGTKQEAKDIFHDTLTVFRENLLTGKFRGKASIQTYIYSIGRNLWVKELARRNRQQISISEMIDEITSDVDKYLIDVEIVTLLMSELKDDCRSILTEYYFNNRSMEELKVIVNVSSVQAAKNKKWRCLNHLKKIFIEKSIIPLRMKNE